MKNVCQALLCSAIQRCRTTESVCRITIAFRKSKQNDSTFQASISDTGPGIEPYEFLRTTQIYSTSQDPWDGLLNIITTDMEKAQVHNYQLTRGDGNGNGLGLGRILDLSSTSKGSSSFSGTEVSLTIEGNLEDFIKYMNNLCEKISILKMRTIALEMYVEYFDNSKTSYNHLFMSNEGIFLPKSMTNIDRLSKGVVDHRMNFVKRLDKQAKEPFVFRESFQVGRGITFIQDSNTNVDIILEVVVMLEITKATNTCDSMEPIVQTKVLYYEDYFPSAVTVSVLQALRSVDWINYGLNMKGIEVDDFGDASVECEGLRTDLKFDIILHKYRTEYPAAKRKKTSESASVKEALGMAMDDLKERNPELLLSQHACKMKKYAPDLSRSISGLVMSSNDMSFKDECSRIVGIAVEDLHQEMLTSCINTKICDVIDMIDRNPNTKSANKNIENICEEPSNEEQEDEYDNEHGMDEYKSIWDFL